MICVNETTGLVTAAQNAEYETKGFTVLERVISPEHLTLLQQVCDDLQADANAEMDKRGSDRLGLSFRNSRYFLSAWHHDSRIQKWVFSDTMAELCRTFVGPDAMLSFEQFVVKCPEKGMTFSWHQDAGYVPADRPSYVSFWCMLDDVTEENGTVYLLPYDRAGTRNRVEHVKDEAVGDLVGYTGDDPGDPVVAPAGSIAVFHSNVFHRSGANTTNGIRRIYLPQYSPSIMMNKEGTGAVYIAEPLLKDGVKVA